MSYTDLCQTVTASIVDAIEGGNLGRWSAPWHRNPTVWAPTNARTGNPYAGGNIVALAASALDRGFESAQWATYRQWDQLGAQVRRGERSTRVVKWIPTRSSTDTTETASRPAPTVDSQPEGQRTGSGRLVPRVYRVFNAAQVDGYEPPSLTPVPVPERIAVAQEWIDRTGAVIAYGFGHACYRIPVDRIEVPAIDQYDDPVDHVITVAHELIHWTRHPSRLNRDFTNLGVDAYAAEELVAELGAAFCAARLGLDNRPRRDHAQYLASWLYLLQADPRTLFTSAALVQRAIEYLNPPNLNEQPVDPLPVAPPLGAGAQQRPVATRSHPRRRSTRRRDRGPTRR